MKFLKLLLLFLFLSNIAFAGRKNLREDSSISVAGVEYKISDIIARAGLFYRNKSLVISKFFKKFNKNFVVNIFLLAWSGYVKSFDEKKPYLMKKESVFSYKDAIKGLFLLRKDLFPALNDCSFLHEIVYHADRDLLIFFMNRVLPNKKEYINLAYFPNYRSEAETLLDLARFMKDITKEDLGINRYERIEKYLKNQGGLGEEEFVVDLETFIGKQKRTLKKDVILKGDEERVVLGLLSFRLRDLIEKACIEI